MTAFDNILKRTREVDAQVDRLIIDEVRTAEAKVVRLQTDQMFAGERGDGQAIAPPYTPVTVAIKRRKRQPFNRVTLRDTGDFQDDIVIDYGPDSFAFDSVDDKREKLVAKYGTDIFGLNDASLQKLIDTIREDFILNTQKAILHG
jgi:hypothetical protein